MGLLPRVPFGRAHSHTYPERVLNPSAHALFLIFQSKELTARHHCGLQAALTVPSQDLLVLMEEAEASLTGLSLSRLVLFPNSHASGPNDQLLCSPSYPFQRSSKMVKCLVNPWWTQQPMTGQISGMPVK